MKTKLSSEQASQILAQVPGVLRSQQQTIGEQAAEITSLTEKVAFYQRRERVEKIATVMESKGLDPESDFSTKVASLMEESSDLDVIEKAIEMSAPQIKLASVSDNPGNPSDSESAFLAEIMNQ